MCVGARAPVCVRVCERVCVCVRARVCVRAPRACERACMRVRVCARMRAGRREEYNIYYTYFFQLRCYVTYILLIV